MNLQARAMNIVMKPAQEWRVINGEMTTPAELLINYAAPMTAIAAVCRFIGTTMIGVAAPLAGTVRIGVVRGFLSALVSWILGLVGAYLAALVIDKLSPTFQSRGGITQALKLVVYAATPVWIGGILNLIPAFALLQVLIAFYAVYLFYLGLPILMQTPADKVVPYMVVSAVAVVVLTVVVGAILAALTGGVNSIL